MSKAIIVYRIPLATTSLPRWKVLTAELPLPIKVVNKGLIEGREAGDQIAISNTISIDLAPEEEYFYAMDHDWYEYIIPVVLKDKWKEIDKQEFGDYHAYNEALNKEFGQYGIDSFDNEKFKITKR